MRTIKASEMQEDEFGIMQEDGVVVKMVQKYDGSKTLIVWCDLSEWAEPYTPHVQMDDPAIYYASLEDSLW